MKKILSSIFTITILSFGITNVSAANEAKFYDIKNAEQTTMKTRCQCKKHFQNHLALTSEQIELVDANRNDLEKELKPINKKIKAKYNKIKEIKNSDKNTEIKAQKINKIKEDITRLKAKKETIKNEHTKVFEAYLSAEQLKTLEYMREIKKQGKSCCPCGKNYYY